MAHDVFISYSTIDKPVADAVCATLERNKLRCWIAPRDVLPGSIYGEAIVEAIKTSRAMVLVFSSASNASPQVMREVERAVSTEIPIVPVRIDDVKPTKSMEFFLSVPHWLDAVTPPIESHLNRLADVTMRIVSPSTDDPKQSNQIQIGTARSEITEATVLRKPANGIAHRSNRYAISPVAAVLLVLLTVLLTSFLAIAFFNTSQRNSNIAASVQANSTQSEVAGAEQSNVADHQLSDAGAPPRDEKVVANQNFIGEKYGVIEIGSGNVMAATFHAIRNSTGKLAELELVELLPTWSLRLGQWKQGTGFSEISFEYAITRVIESYHAIEKSGVPSRSILMCISSTLDAVGDVEGTMTVRPSLVQKQIETAIRAKLKHTFQIEALTTSNEAKLAIEGMLPLSSGIQNQLVVDIGGGNSKGLLAVRGTNSQVFHLGDGVRALSRQSKPEMQNSLIAIRSRLESICKNNPVQKPPYVVGAISFITATWVEAVESAANNYPKEAESPNRYFVIRKKHCLKFREVLLEAAGGPNASQPDKQNLFNVYIDNLEKRRTAPRLLNNLNIFGSSGKSVGVKA